MDATDFEPGRNIPIGTVPNLRDAGGYATSDGGRVRTGMVYRSVELGKLEGADVELFGDLGIGTVFDLRTAAEREASPDRAPGTRQVNLDVIADSTGSAAAQLLQLIHDPTGAATAMGGGSVAAIYTEAYTEFVELDSAHRSYNRMFSELAEARDLPGLIHCSAGKDRTGWAVASLLLLLGVSEADVERDYLRTNEQLIPALQPTFDAFEAAGGDPDLMRSVFSVRREYLQTSLDIVLGRHGSIEGYFQEDLGLDESTVQALRDRLVESPN